MKESAFVRLPIVFCFHVELSQSVRWLAVFLWRPLAGREGRTVLCADVYQALAGLETSQRLAAREGGQGPTQAHHGGGVVLFWRGGTEIQRKSQFKCVCVLTRLSTHKNTVRCSYYESFQNLTCAPSSTVLFPLHPL